MWLNRWLEKQAIWQIYLPAPKYIPRPHWTVDKPKSDSPSGFINFYHMIELEEKHINTHWL